MCQRDIYANFPDKHALMAAAIRAVVDADHENFSSVVAHTANSPFKKRIGIIGLALANEVLAPTTRFVFRMISSESVKQPDLGTIYIDYWYARRCRGIAKVLSDHVAAKRLRLSKTWKPALAAREYCALVLHVPQLTVMAGMRDSWNVKDIEAHVEEAVLCFLRAYPALG